MISFETDQNAVPTALTFPGYEIDLTEVPLVEGGLYDTILEVLADEQGLQALLDFGFPLRDEASSATEISDRLAIPDVAEMVFGPPSSESGSVFSVPVTIRNLNPSQPVSITESCTVFDGGGMVFYTNYFSFQDKRFQAEIGTGSFALEPGQEQQGKLYFNTDWEAESMGRALLVCLGDANQVIGWDSAGEQPQP